VTFWFRICFGFRASSFGFRDSVHEVIVPALLTVFLLGVCLGAAANLAIYRLAWYPRPISPWSLPDPAAPPRRLWDRLPIVGWLGLRREAGLHGAGFWVRPMCVELLGGIGLAWLYWWEVTAAGLLPPGAAPLLGPDVRSILRLEFVAHTVLITLMLAASFIDIDEKIIPDAITIPGTLIGLLLAAAWPWSLLPDVVSEGGKGQWQLHLEFLRLSSPNPWPNALGGCPQIGSLCQGLACWWLWCAAILPRTWYPRHGWRRAAALCWARVVRERGSYRILRMAIMGALAIALVWYRSEPGWEALLSALVGMAASGGLVWLVRVIGTAVLRREAMGFGDVTLMAMIGAFLGWQAGLIVFFLAPFAGLVIGVLRLIVCRDKEIPYGPFLCLAALVLIVRWPAIWDYTVGVFSLGWLVPLVVLCCLMLMGVMLGMWRGLLAIFRLIASATHSRG
jgi:leader peptidase (prepilin peptidase) / N-methyltransferase